MPDDARGRFLELYDRYLLVKYEFKSEDGENLYCLNIHQCSIFGRRIRFCRV